MHPIAMYRKKLGWSQSELSRRSGVHPSSISQFENGRLLPYPSQIKKLAKALGVFPIDLQHQDVA
jgi:transcriptional regulator with XRE-family HTH domain